MYENVPLKKDTKKMLDEFKEVFKSKSYDETVKELGRANGFLLLKDLKGIIAGSPRFEREKLERDFSGH